MIAHVDCAGFDWAGLLGRLREIFEPGERSLYCKSATPFRPGPANNKRNWRLRFAVKPRRLKTGVGKKTAV